MKIKSMFKHFLILSLVDGSKISQRFKPIPPGFVLRANQPAEMGGGIDPSTPGLPRIEQFIGRMNRMPKIGEVVNEATCEYDGMVGMVQRNEVDLLSHMVRPDSTPCEPGIFLTLSALDDSPRIFSVRQTSNKTIVQDILYLWTNFRPNIWFYLVISLLICSIILSMIYCVLQSVPYTRDMMRLFVDSFWDYYLLSVDMAPTTISPYRSGVILWTCIVLGLFYAFHIVLLGTLSTDLVVAVTPREIETLKDLLYDPEFSKITPAICRQLNMYNVLKNSRNGTDARVLFDMIRENETASIREFNLKDPQNMQGPIEGLFNQVTRGEVVIIENSEFLIPGMIHGLCYFNPTLISSLRPADDIISQSILSGLVSKQTPDSVRHLLQFRMTATSEFGLIKGSAQSLGKSLLSGMVVITTDALICGEKFDNTFRDEQDMGTWVAFDLKPFIRLFAICLAILVIAAQVCVVECVMGFFTRDIMTREEMMDRKKRRMTSCH